MKEQTNAGTSEALPSTASHKMLTVESHQGTHMDRNNRTRPGRTYDVRRLYPIGFRQTIWAMALRGFSKSPS